MSCGKKDVAEQLEDERIERYQKEVDHWIAKISVERTRTHGRLIEARENLVEIRQSARLSYYDHTRLERTLILLAEVLAR